nr:MAG: ORF1 [TTV-like mini virus]
MPYYYGWNRYRTYNPWRKYRKPRRNRYARPYRRRRTRTTLRGRRRRRRVRRRYFTKKKKLKYLKVKQYQPRTINKCKVRGFFCLVECGQGRQSHNYAQWQTTRFPPDYPSGGAFSIIIFSLSSLFEDYKKDRNWWTKTNNHLDLVRYTHTTLKFWRHTDVDYIVAYNLCPPMQLHKYSHMQTHPYQLLLNTHKIIIPSHKTRPDLKKPYIRKILRPPKQMVNKWFFQTDFANTPLFMLHTSTASLSHMYQPINQKSNTIGLLCINTKIFKHNNFANATGYYLNDQFSYWGTVNGNSRPQLAEFIPLTATSHTPGYPNNGKTAAVPGNILYTTYVTDKSRVWQTAKTTGSQPSTQPTLLDVPLIYNCRYNAYADDGDGNEVYLLSTLTQDQWNPHTKEDFYMSGHPLWLMCWGITDWWRKIRPASQIDMNYIFVIRSKYLYPQLPAYVPIDESFLHDEGPWGTNVTDLSASNLKHWYPRIFYQQKSINDLCMSGPAVPQAEYLKGWSAHMQYTVHIKWGGCPTPGQFINDPLSQPKYDVPDKIFKGPQITDPEEQTPENQTYQWDFRRGIITPKAIQRLSKDIDYDKSLTEQKRKRSTDVPAGGQPNKIQKLLQETQVLLQSPPQETQTETLNLQLQRLRIYQHQMQLNLFKLMTKMYKQQKQNTQYLNPLPQ